MLERVAITGIGISCGNGNTIEEFSTSLKNQVSSIGPVKAFDASKYRVNLGSNVNLDKISTEFRNAPIPRTLKILLHAAHDALNSASLAGQYLQERKGVYLAGPACSVFESERFYTDFLTKGLDKTSLRDLCYSSWDVGMNVLCDHFGLFGPRNTILTACSSAGVAIGMGFDAIRLGDADVMVVGGTDGFSELTYSGFHALNSVSDVPCRPFDADRKGLSFGEGAGILVLENFNTAQKRGARILAEIVGYGAIGEGYNLTAPNKSGIGYIKTMEKAIQQAQIHSDQIGYVNAHGTATPVNDVVEAQAIAKVFKDRLVPVNSIKSLVGHCMGAAGAVEAVNCVVSLMEQFIPGTKNLQKLDPEININAVKETQEARFDYVLSNSAGFGGNHVSVLFKKGEVL